MPSITTCTVTGNVVNIFNAAVTNCTLKVSAITPFFHPTNGSWISGELESVVTDSTGAFSVTVIETTTPGAKLAFMFEYYDGVANRRTKTYNIIVPSQASALLSDLVAATTTSMSLPTFPAGQVTVNTGTGLTATNVQAALTELKADISGLSSITALTGDVTATGTGSVAATVASVGGSTAAHVHAAELLANAATNANTVSTVVKRDASGNFSAGTITANLTGNASGTAANITGTAAVANGGTGQTTAAAAYNALSPMTTLGDIEYESGANTASRLAGNTTSTKKFLTQTGTGTVSAAPGWNTIAAGDVPTLNQNTTGSAASFTGSLAGDVTGTQSATTVGKINGTSLAGLATGILKNTTTTGVPSIAVAGDFPTLNQNTTGTAANVTGVVATANGGTGQNSTATFPTSGTVLQSTPNNHGILISTTTGAVTVLAPDASTTKVLTSGGTGADPSWQPAGTASPLTTKGDFYTFSSTNVRHGVPGDYGDLIPDAAQTDGWRTATYTQKQHGRPGKNYIQYADFNNQATTGWSLSHTTLSGLVPNQVSGSWSSASGSLAITAATSGQLAGVASIQQAWTGTTSVPGDMLVSQVNTIDLEDQAKVLAYKFYYSATVGASLLNFSGTSANTYQVWIYDVTNSAWIQPTGAYNLIQGSGVGIAQGTFQTPSNMTQFRLALVCINASTTGSHTLLLDDFYVGPQAMAFGPPESDWTAFPMVVTGSTSNPTFANVTINNAYWKQLGDSMLIRYTLSQTSGTAGSGTILFGLPNSHTIDTTKVDANTNNIYGIVGQGAVSQVGNFNSEGIWVKVYDSSHLCLGTAANNSPLSSTTLPFNSASTTNLSFEAIVPITGWSSNTAMSSDTDTRVIAMQANASSTTISSSLADIVWTTTVNDTAGAFGGTTYTIPVTGYYHINAKIRSTATYAVNQTGTVAILKNGSTVSQQVVSVGSTTQNIVNPCADWVGLCNAGDTIKIQYADAGTSPSIVASSVYNTFGIFRLSGPAVIAATESVSCRYTNSAGTSITTTPTVLPFATKVFDSHGSTFVSGVYTAPVSGTYEIRARATASSGTLSQGIFIELDLYKNAVQTSVLAISDVVDTSNTRAITGAGSDIIQLIAGDTLSLKVFLSGGSDTLVANAIWNFISINRIGN